MYTQDAQKVPSGRPEEEGGASTLPGAADRSYHTERAGRMDIRQLDPSLALVSAERDKYQIDRECPTGL